MCDDETGSGRATPSLLFRHCFPPLFAPLPRRRRRSRGMCDVMCDWARKICNGVDSDAVPMHAWPSTRAATAPPPSAAGGGGRDRKRARRDADTPFVERARVERPRKRRARAKAALAARATHPAATFPPSDDPAGAAPLPPPPPPAASLATISPTAVRDDADGPQSCIFAPHRMNAWPRRHFPFAWKRRGDFAVVVRGQDGRDIHDRLLLSVRSHDDAVFLGHVDLLRETDAARLAEMLQNVVAYCRASCCSMIVQLSENAEGRERERRRALIAPRPLPCDLIRRRS